MGLAAVSRLQGLEQWGLSSDEAVYLGQGHAVVEGRLPEVRAHPPLFGLLLGAVPGGTTGELVPRTVAVLLGLAAVVVAGLLGTELAGRTGGAVAALAVATMPYHADVTRLVLVEVPMATTVGLALLLTVRSVRRGHPGQLEGAAAALGVATLFKETAVLSAVALAVAVLVGVVPAHRRVVARAAAWYVLVVATYPLYLAVTGGLSAALEFARWQLSRAAPTGPSYTDVVLPRMGWVVLAAAVAGAVLVLVRRTPEGVTVALAAAVPALFYTVWPVSSYPYLLVVVVPVGALAGTAVAAALRHPLPGGWPARGAFAMAGTAAVVAVGAAPATGGPPELPGASGVPAVREAASWLDHSADRPVVTAAPWVANILRAYLPDRSVASVRPAARGLSRVNPADRDETLGSLPSGPVAVVWDAWTATHDPVATAQLLAEVRGRGGRVAHVEARESGPSSRPLVVVYVVGAGTEGGAR
ncbi:glycosyltransferase family 39 protein [Oryzobacter sp. R7]|uniref:glycosyltransferase family 39 protein n=1 Tax=Oryzobacter faecalis TaxID=3388656 RepID=UPI00398CADE6